MVTSQPSSHTSRRVFCVRTFASGAGPSRANTTFLSGVHDLSAPVNINTNSIGRPIQEKTAHRLCPNTQCGGQHTVNALIYTDENMALVSATARSIVNNAIHVKVDVIILIPVDIGIAMGAQKVYKDTSTRGGSRFLTKAGRGKGKPLPWRYERVRKFQLHPLQVMLNPHCKLNVSCWERRGHRVSVQWTTLRLLDRMLSVHGCVISRLRKERVVPMT